MLLFGRPKSILLIFAYCVYKILDTILWFPSIAFVSNFYQICSVDAVCQKCYIDCGGKTDACKESKD
jgi:hypothetical protein